MTEEEIVTNHTREKEALIVYRLMRVEHCIDQLAETIGKTDQPFKIKKQAYVKSLHEQNE